MIVIYCQHRDGLTRTEGRMVAAMRDLPGLLLVNALVTTGRRTREIDGIWIHRGGIAAIEAKGTHQSGPVTTTPNGPWRIAAETADFASGPNPLIQARTAAQTLRRVLTEHGTDPGFIPAVVAVSGTGLDLPAHMVGDMPVLRVDDLSALPSLLPSGAAGTDDVAAVLKALGIDPLEHPEPEELVGEGFEAGAKFRAPRARREPDADDGARHTPNSRPGSSTGETRAKPPTKSQQRRARRFSDLEAEARRSWRSLHRRRLIASAIAAAILLAYLPRLPAYCVLNGLICGVIAAAYQLAVRRRLSGPRDKGKLAFAAWLLTLTPVVGMGASLSWVAAVPVLTPMAWPFVLMLAILIAMGVGCAILTGKNAYIHPPAIVIERYDEQGRPTGAFMLADANPIHFPSRDWRPASAKTQQS